MEYYFILAATGLVMGTFGGLLGIGGSIVMIPALVLAFGKDQHLCQAAAMICNFFVCIAAVAVHKKANVLVMDVVKWLVPAGIIGIIAGVSLSNIDFFAGSNSINLTRLFGLFTVYVAVYNIRKFSRHDGGSDGLDISGVKRSTPLTLFTGLATGLVAGLLGLGGGTVCTPMQQLCLKMPLKRAISNSSALIASTALIGAFYKNITLTKHGIAVGDSLKIAVVVIPTAVIGGLIGGRLLHKLPKNIVRLVFIALLIIAAIKMLTVKPT
jgi:uncharacterized membrane protein YfcA